MTSLIPMRPEIYPAYIELFIAGYAESNVASGRWSKDSALEHSRAEIESLLPQGVHTTNNHLYEIINDPTGTTVGFIWFAVQEWFGIRTAFVCDVFVEEKFRRQGHAKRAFFALESIASELKLSAIRLHVFAHNTHAQALYEQLGYTATSIYMRKSIDTRNSSTRET